MNATILLVDDERDLVDLWREYLAAQGHLALVAHDVRAAAATLQRVSPDVVVVDFQLPDGSAADVISALRACGHAAPVILCSGRGDDLPMSLLGGGHLILGKPFRLDQLDEAIRQALSRRDDPPLG
jgi:DNA-binding response OmpR family regulator